MAGEGEHIHPQSLDIHRDVADCLDGIGMEPGAMGVGDSSQLRNGLHGADLVIRQHDGNQRGILPDGLFHGGTGGAPDGINAAGVAVVLHQPGGHGLQHCRRDRSGGGVIGVNKALFHSDTLPLSI